MFQQTLTISRNTFVESIRQPVFVVVIIASVICLWMNPHLAAYTFDDDNKMMIDLGLSVLFLSGLLLAALTATGVLSAEIENRTVLTVVSKPVPRPVFVLGKFLGVAAALSLAYWTLTMTFLLHVRHRVMQTASDPVDWPVVLFAAAAILLAIIIAALANYLYHWVFASTFVWGYLLLNTVAWLLVLVVDKHWDFQPIATEFVKDEGRLVQLLYALLLLFEAVLVLTGLALAISTRLGQVMTILICLGVFLLGLISNSMNQQYGDRNLVVRVAYWVLPNLQYLWHADALTSGHAITPQHIAFVSAYSALYIGALIFLAIALFQSREVG
ncbi:MAG: hypothetical protein CMJ18_06400 [Phycisphaeraceae bacterium]|nr:hypothetical protein [Phycisphaeraceae bacterium]